MWYIKEKKLYTCVQMHLTWHMYVCSVFPVSYFYSSDCLIATTIFKLVISILFNDGLNKANYSFFKVVTTKQSHKKKLNNKL